MFAAWLALSSICLLPASFVLAIPHYAEGVAVVRDVDAGSRRLDERSSHRVIIEGRGHDDAVQSGEDSSDIAPFTVISSLPSPSASSSSNPGSSTSSLIVTPSRRAPMMVTPVARAQLSRMLTHWLTEDGWTPIPIASESGVQTANSATGTASQAAPTGFWWDGIFEESADGEESTPYTSSPTFAASQPSETTLWDNRLEADVAQASAGGPAVSLSVLNRNADIIIGLVAGVLVMLLTIVFLMVKQSRNSRMYQAVPNVFQPVPFRETKARDGDEIADRYGDPVSWS